MESRAVPHGNMHRVLMACGELIEEMYIRLLVDRWQLKTLVSANTHLERARMMAPFAAAIYSTLR